jgi:hypothetical protein
MLTARFDIVGAENTNLHFASRGGLNWETRAERERREHAILHGTLFAPIDRNILWNKKSRARQLVKEKGVGRAEAETVHVILGHFIQFHK